MAKLNKAQADAQLRKQLHHASTLIKQGEATKVLGGLMLLAQKHPNNAVVFDLLCSCNNEMGRRQEAIEAGAKAVAITPKNPDTRIRYAMALQAGGEYQQALVECERALYHDPENIYALKTILGIHTDTADHPKALEALERVQAAADKLGLKPIDTIGISLNRARLSPKPLPPEPVIEELIPLAENTTLPDPFRLIAYHHIGRLCENIKDHERAIKYWTKGNEINKPDWDPDVHSKYIDKLIQCWQSFEKIPPAQTKYDGSKLIFVVGMMRSGTSLTEQMLAQIPDITPGGEMNAINRAAYPFEPFQNPQGSQNLPVTPLVYNQRVINEISRTAAAQYKEISETNIVTDKQPHNMFWVPLIARIFPKCKIIHCTRDAQDNCLSNFQQSYSRPHPHTHDLYWLGRYHADYQRMMNAWHKLPGLEILDVQYEETVADPEGQSKKVCEFIGLPWTEDILNFHKSSRTIRTASRDQVRKPIYQSSVKKHTLYAQHLAPLRQGLGIDDCDAESQIESQAERESESN